MKMLSNNQALYDYMQSLSLKLKQYGLVSLGDAVASATGVASSSSTEFLGESRIALRRVSKEEQGVLTTQERSDLADVLKQLDQAING